MVSGEGDFEMSNAEFRGVVEAWIADDPDAGDRAGLRALLERAFGEPGTGADPRGDSSDPESAESALAELRDRFAGRLEFGTAGLRGVVAAGPNRMNRAVVRAATAAVAGWLLGAGPGDARGSGWLLGAGPGDARGSGWLLGTGPGDARGSGWLPEPAGLRG